LQDRSGRHLAIKLLCHPLEVVLCCILVAMVVITFSQVVSRYVFHVSLSWSEEAARFLLIWLAMLSAAYGFKVRTHIALTIVVKHFGAKAKLTVGVFIVVAMALFLSVFIFEAVAVTQNAVGRISPGMQISMAVPYSSTIVGGVLMLYYVLQTGWRDFREQGRGQGKQPGAGQE